MIRKLSKHGNGRALVIERGILDLLNINDNTPLEVSTDGKSLTIAPVTDPKRVKRFQSLLKAGNQQYSKALQRLAQ